MSLEETMQQITETLGKEGNVRAVFGEPLKLEHHSVIPVAAVGVGGGGGIGKRPPATGAQSADGANAAAGGMAFAVRPLGFIHESGSEVVFTPIQSRPANPFLTQAASSLGRVINTVSGVFGSR